MKRFVAPILLMSFVAVATTVRGGHELPVYPSYYPHEVTINTLDPKVAAERLVKGKIQAYIGAEPEFAGAVPEFIKSIETFGSYVLVTVNPDSPRLKDGAAACRLSSAVARPLAEGDSGFVFHPYPVSPLHGGYLHHFDRAEAAKARLAASGADISGLKVRAVGARAERLVASRWTAADSDWDVSVEAVSVKGMTTIRTFNVNGWHAYPWLKKGWYHAYLLLADALTEKADRQRVDELVDLLKSGAHGTLAERINQERDLVSLLTRDCTRSVVGYMTEKEFYSDEFTFGMENVAFDSYSGFNSAVFMRTVKLKDLPWNGWLDLGVRDRPTAAWNPVAGFTDDVGRLIWHAVGDFAFFPEPYNASWSVNRIGGVEFTPDP